ncbi:probable E3 ubiquitin-protein ligase RHG1A isoform X2 [Populus alba]|uniref:probable E3 ubiquitin-protein ligase RHG1A isoform X2 n=1 Tax=Populus alba TaxID=43335 RepID=UPI00158F2973|nr:probable E3 ubiquitin-protein ligase RHG1A isoform X3 [Populus alba]
MQGQRSIIGSLPETLDFDHGSTSGNAIIDQQICLSNMRNPAENRLTEFMLSPSRMNNPYANSIDQERQNLSGWSLGEPSSSGQQNQAGHDDRKLEHGWSSSASSSAGAGPRLEERRYEPTNILSLNRVNVNPQFERISNSDAIPQNINLNAGFVGHGGDNCQVMDASAIYKPIGAESERNSPASGPDNFLRPGNGGYLVEQNDGRPGCSLDGRRQSCKRKAVEGNIGQSSVAGSSSFYQRSESNPWPGVPSRYDAGSSLSISAPSEQVNPRLGLAVRGLACDAIPESAVAERAESSHRNFRLRINSSNPESSPPSLFSTGSTVRRSSLSSSHRSSRPLPIDHSLDFRSSSAMDSITPQNQPVLPAPALPQNVQSFRWNESSSSRTGTSSSSISLDDREEPNARNMTRHIWEHPIFAPATELRTSVRNPANRSLTSGQVSGPGNVGSTSRTGASPGIHPLSAPTWGPHTNPPSRNSRRLAEYARRSLFSSSAAAADTGGQSSTHSPFHSGASSSEDTVPSSGAGNQGLHRPHPRSASWLERQGDGVLGIPYPLRALSSEGRSRLVVSEVITNCPLSFSITTIHHCRLAATITGRHWLVDGHLLVGNGIHCGGLPTGQSLAGKRSMIRNVLDLMRRGESLRFEDVMILDQSVLFGAADMYDRHRDMRLDVDNMSYEELLALEERIGNVSTGLSEETIVNNLKQQKYSVAVGAKVEAEPCCICQEEYNDGEDLGTLDCGHDFHAECVKQWLMHKNWCPICKTTGLAT